MAPYGGGHDYIPQMTIKDARPHIDSEAAWTKVDLGLIIFLILLTIIGLVLGI